MGMRRIFRRRRPDELQRIDAEITAFGEELARHSLVPGAQDKAVLTDYQRALDAYERAKRDFEGDRDSEDAADVLQAIQDGRRALARVDARLAGRPLPEERPLCFFDERHGPSTTRVRWSPPEGAARMIDVCAADAVRITEGAPPIATGRPAPKNRPAPRNRPARKEKRPSERGQRAFVTPPPPRPAARPAPFRTWPEGTDESRRASGQGQAVVELAREGADRPAILVIRLLADGVLTATVDVNGGRRKRFRLKGDCTRRAVVPLPPDGSPTVRISFDGNTPQWKAWLQSVESVPVATRRMTGSGMYVFRYNGRPDAWAHMSQAVRAEFALTALTPDLTERTAILTGTKEPVAGRLERRSLLWVESEQDWIIDFN